MLAVLLYLASASLLLFIAHRSVRRLTFAAALVLLLIPLCFTGRALLTGRVYGPVDLAFMTEPLSAMKPALGLPMRAHNVALFDIAWQMLPWRAAEARVVGEGAWPLWNRYMYGGGVLAASAQPAAYSPFTLSACLLPIGTGTTYLASVWFFVAALSAFLLAREFDCRPLVGLYAAAAWAFSTAISFFILWPLGQSWTLAPLVLLAVMRIVRDPRFASTTLLAVALALLVLAGHPESVLEVVLTGCLFGLFLLAEPGVNRRGTLSCALAGGALAVLITAIYLLPVIEALPQTGEYLARRASPEAGAGGWEAVARLAVDLVPWLQFRVWRPSSGVTGMPPLSASVGSLTVALAAFAIARVRSRKTYFFAALLALGLIAGTDYRPVVRLWNALPLFSLAHNNTLVFAAALAMVMLACFGLERAAEHSEWRTLAIWTGAAATVVAVASLAIDRADLVAPWQERWGNYKYFAEIAAPAVIALIFLIPMRARHALVASLAVLLAQRAIEEGGVYPVLPPRAAYPPVPLLSSLQGVKEPFRIVGQYFAFIPGTSAAYGLEDVRGYTAMTLAPFYETWPLWCVHQPGWFNRVDDLDRPFLSFLNVRYAITGAGERDHEGWREVARGSGARLLENTRVIDRAFIPEIVVLGQGNPVGDMHKATDFRRRAWIRAEAPHAEFQNGTGTIAFHRTKLGYRIDATMDRAGWIVLSEQNWRGWRAYIDDRRVRIHPANIAFLGVYVPEGKHVVDVRYWPESFVIGRAISAITLIGLIGFAIIRRR